MMIPESYWKLVDTPSKGSTIGRIMQTLNMIYPDKPLEQLRHEANERIHSGGSGKVKLSKDEMAKLKIALLPPRTAKTPIVGGTEEKL